MTTQDWARLTEEDYRRLFKGSAVKRAKYSGVMRNIRAVLNKQGEIRSTDITSAGLSDKPLSQRQTDSHNS